MGTENLGKNLGKGGQDKSAERARQAAEEAKRVQRQKDEEARKKREAAEKARETAARNAALRAQRLAEIELEKNRKRQGK